MDTEEIAQITVKGTSEGMDQVKSDIDGVTKAQDNLAQQSTVTATVTETAAKKHLDAASAYDKLHNSLDGTAGATAAFATRQTLINNALSQGHITQAQAAADLTLLAERYPKAAQAQDVLGNGLIKLSSLFNGSAAEGTKAAEIATLLEGRELKLASSVGLVGEALAIVGPVGLAVVASLGAVAVGVDKVVSSANSMGEFASKISSVSNATEISTDSIQALATAGAKFGLSTEQTGQFLERFTLQLSEAHDGTGNLYAQLQKINPALASEVSASTSSAQALSILAKASRDAADQSERLALAKAAGAPRGDVGAVSELLGSIGDKGGVDAITDSVNKLDVITNAQIEHWHLLGAQINDASEKAHNNIASIFTGPVLEAELSFYENLLKISQLLKSSGVSDGLNRLAVPSNLGSGDIVPINGYGGSAAPGTGTQGSASDPVALNSGARSAEADKAAIDALNGSIGDEIAKQKLLVSSLGGAATATDILSLKQLELQKAYQTGAFGKPDTSAAMAAAAAAQDQLDIANEIAQAQDRQKEKAAELAEAYGGVSQATAKVLNNLDGQISVASAVGQAAKQQAQEQATINALVAQGTQQEEAAAIAAAQYAVAQASVASAAQATHAAALDQLAIAEALTVPQKQQAQYQADYNAELLKTGDALLAEQAASDKLAVSQASAQTAAQQTVQSSQDNLDKINAQGTAMAPVVAASIAYRDAIAAGATSMQAGIIYSNTLAANMKSVAGATQAAAAAAEAFENAQRAAHDAQFVDFTPGGDNAFGEFQTKSGVEGNSVSAIPLDVLWGFSGKKWFEGIGWVTGLKKDSTAALPSGGDLTTAGLTKTSKSITTSPTDLANASIAGGGVDSAISSLIGLHGTGDSDSVLQSLFLVKNSQTTDKTAQAANLETLVQVLQSEPATIARLQQISDLQQSIQQLTTSTDGLNSTNQDLLSPFYSQDPRTSHIGFRSQGMASGGEFTVPGGYSSNDNMIGTIPLASGEIVSVRRPGENSGGSQSQTVVINQTFNVGGNVNRDEFGRTAYQAGQSAARSLRAASQ